MSIYDGLKAIKSGKNGEEKITRCEVYEFNVQAAYQDLSSKLGVFEEKLSSLKNESNQKHWLEIIKNKPILLAELNQNEADIEKVDAFKAVLNIPGPSWSEKKAKASAELADLDKKARSNIIVIFPENQFEAPIAEIEGRLTNSGIKSTSSKGPHGDSLAIEVVLKTLGKPVHSKTKLGLTVTRKISIALIDLKTKSKLATGGSLSIVGASLNGSEEEAIANGDSQLMGALSDAFNHLAPTFIRNDSAL